MAKRLSRFQAPAGFQVLCKYIHGSAEASLVQALQHAGINPALVKDHLPKVLQAFVPALATAMTQRLYHEGGAIAAEEGSILLSQVQQAYPTETVSMRPVNGQAPTPVQAHSHNGDAPPSLSGMEHDFQP